MKQVATALLKAKRSFNPVLKDKANPAFKGSKYADLAACLDAVDQPCLDAGIVLYQETSDDANGVTVETVFLHESGEALRCGKLHVPASKNDAQGYGSALSYARRYSLLAACGIAAEDDDGNAAGTRKPETRQPDVASILRGISGSATLEVLRSNYEAAMQMLPENHHPAIKKAATARKAELTAKEEA